MNNKATPRLADVQAAQNDGPSHGAVGHAPSLSHWAASAWVAWCVSCRAMTCHGPACRTANNAARFCLSWSPLTLRDSSCREGDLIIAIADVVGLFAAVLSEAGPAAEPYDCASEPHKK